MLKRILQAFGQSEPEQGAVEAESVAVEPGPDAVVARDDGGNQDEAGVLYDQGLARLQEQDWAGALAAFERALELAPGEVRFWEKQGLALQQLGRYGEAIEANRRAMALTAATVGMSFKIEESIDPSISPQLDFAVPLAPADSWLALAEQQYMSGDLQGVLESLDRTLELNPNFLATWGKRGQVLQNLGRYEEAITSYDRALELKPNFPGAWSDRGMALYNLGRYEEAITSYDRALELNPNLPEVWSSRGKALDYLGHYEEAIESYNRALGLNANLSEVWSSRGRSLDSLSRYEEALASYDRALELNPNYPNAWEGRGSILDNLGYHEEAIENYDRALELNSNFSEVWINRGTVLNNLGRYEKALASCDCALEIDPNYHHAWYVRGFSLNGLGRYEEAIANCDRALSFEPTFHGSWYVRGHSAGKSLQCKTPVLLSLPATMQNPNLDKRGYEGAVASYEEGFKYFRQDDQPEGWGKLHREIGIAHYFQGQGQSNPAPYYRKAIASYETALTTLTAVDFPEAHLNVLQDLIRAQLGLAAQLKLKNAQTTKDLQVQITELRVQGLEVFRQLLNAQPSPEQKRRLEATFSGFSQTKVDVLLQDKQPIAALETAERYKNRALTWLLDSWQEQVTSPSYDQMLSLLPPNSAALFWHLSPDILTTFAIEPNAPEPILIDPAGARQRLQRFETWLKDWNQQYQDYCSKGKGKTTDPTEPPSHPWRTGMESRLTQLRQILAIDAIEQHLWDSEDPAIAHLILIPHRDLHRLPLQVLFNVPTSDLPSPINGEGPGVRATQDAPAVSITCLPSFQIGLTLQQRHPDAFSWQAETLSLVSVENPTHEGTATLPFAEIESAVLCQLLPQSQRLADREATQTAVTAALRDQSDADRSSQRIFHFTGHSRYDARNPQRSALALAGTEQLTAAEIAALNQSPLALVGLAACETAVTGRQTLDTEYVGLVSSFLMAGAAQVLSALWTVEEVSNAWLMLRFYQFLFQGEGPGRALQRAQAWLRTVRRAELAQWLRDLQAQCPGLEASVKALLEDEAKIQLQEADRMKSNAAPYAHPYYWAAFTLTGGLG